ncbi:hypothetical protein JCM11251_000811 [Rhodosporidiobolus azoricus]
MLSRIRLDFCDLGGTKRMLATDDPQRLCECGEGVETRAHHLLECRSTDNDSKVGMNQSINQSIWGEKAVSKVSATVWKDAARLVCGGYRSTLAAALKVEANLPPLDLVLQSLRFRLALRALSAAPQHFLHLPCRLPCPTRLLRHASPLHVALHSFSTLLPPTLQVETLLPWPVAPWASTPPVTTLVVPSKDAGLTPADEHLAALPPLSLVAYSDGSLLDGSVGAASVVEIVGMEGALRKVRVLGVNSTVWAGEGKGAHLSLCSPLDLLSSYPTHLPSLFSSITKPLCHQLVLPAPLPRPVRITMVWCPGHRGIDGNVAVDKLAKAAAKEGVKREGEGEEVMKGWCSKVAGRGRGRRSRTAGRPAALFRALQETALSLSSEGSEWGEGDGEVR